MVRRRGDGGQLDGASNAGPILTAAPGPVLSLGAARRFLIRSVDGGRSIRLTPNAGDLIVMGGRAQKGRRHMMPKQTHPSGPRISVNFKSSEQARSDD